ncbi:hypothetical protein ACHAWF_018172 [Thalassiosira exigua]
MAPLDLKEQEESWGGIEAFQTETADAVGAASSDERNKRADSTAKEQVTSCVTKILAAADEESREPKGILRRPRIHSHGSGPAAAEGGRLKFLSFPSHWPRTSTTVRFPPESSMVTATYTRPRTHILDVPHLFYSPEDIRQFKRQHRSKIRAQNLSREKTELNGRTAPSERKDHGESSGIGFRRQPQQQHPNPSLWRSKIGGRWYGSSAAVRGEANNGAASCAAPERSDAEERSTWDPLNDGSDISSYNAYDSDDDEDDCQSSSSSPPSLFSSVFDVAREAVSILNGPSSRYYYQNDHHPSTTTSAGGVSQAPIRAKKQCTTSLHLVDTLYLF